MMTDQHSASSGWAEHMTLERRKKLIGRFGLGLCGWVGFFSGLTDALVENDVGATWRMAAASLALLSFAALIVPLWKLCRVHWANGARGYERRYERMMTFGGLLFLPFGIAVFFMLENVGWGSFFSNAAMDPAIALALAAALAVALAGFLLLYHRAIDGHEEHSQLWSAAIAYYFLFISLPAAWLLARGGWIEPVGIGTALLLLLVAYLLQCAVWAWLRYR